MVTSIPGPRSQELIARKAAAVAAGVGHTVPIQAVAAGGGVVVDADGNSLIDLGSGIAVTTVGNAHPKVVAAVQAQVAQFTHTCFMIAPYEPRSISEFPSASTTTPPPAATAWIGTVCPTPEATAAAFRSSSSCERGPGMLVTILRSCGRVGPPRGMSVAGAGIVPVADVLMVASVGGGMPRPHAPRCTFWG